MPDLVGNRFLDNAVMGTIVETLVSRLDKKRPLRFLDRVPTRDALDDELFGRWTGNIYAADLIADNQKAVTVTAGKLEVLTTQIPNVKLGVDVDQTMLNRMDAYRQRQASRLEENAMWDYWNNTIANLLMGIRERQNALICAMQLDSIVYDRWGVKISATYGAPSDLKVLPANLWTDAANGAPITDVLNLRNYAINTYGKEYNRLTMTRSDFTNFIATAEFKARVQNYFNFPIAAGSVNVGDWPQMTGFMGRLLDMTVEVDEATYKEQQGDGRTVTRRVLPLGKVILSSTGDDGDDTVMDLANARVTEAMVDALTGGPAGAVSTAARGGFGPFAFWSKRAADNNPPGVVAWACSRCFPRRKLAEATAVITAA